MKTLQFEAVKIALKQNNTGYVLTLNLHPDEIPDDLLRDFVGSRYQVVMVRLNGEEQPLDRQEEFEGSSAVRLAGVLCRDPKFWAFLYSTGNVFEENENAATEWLRGEIGVQTRSELKTNNVARIRLDAINKDFMEWKSGN